MARFALIGSGAGARPVPKKFGPIVKKCLAASGTWLNSGLRTQRAVNFARKRGAALSSQAELYYGWIAGRPGYNPANRPGQSTHERRSDGVAYRGPVGRVLRWWQCGLDIGGPGTSSQNAAAFCRAARKAGWVATVTYPSSPLEQHHVNFRKMPRRPLNLRRGSRGRKVKRYSRRLTFLRRPPGKHPTGEYRYLSQGPRPRFDKHMELAVKMFQKDYGLTRDGIIGPHTAAQLNHVFKAQWKKWGKKRG